MHMTLTMVAIVVEDESGAIDHESSLFVTLLNLKPGTRTRVGEPKLRTGSPISSL